MAEYRIENDDFSEGDFIVLVRRSGDGFYEIAKVQPNQYIHNGDGTGQDCTIIVPDECTDFYSLEDMKAIIRLAEEMGC